LGLSFLKFVIKSYNVRGAFDVHLANGIKGL
jgi:hypothetical protein